MSEQNVVKYKDIEECLSNWTDAELNYFPYSPRVVTGAVASPALDASIAEHFQQAGLSGLNKSDLAKEARRRGIKAIHKLRDVDLTDKQVDEIIKQDDQVIGEERVKQKFVEIRHPNQITGPLLSVADLEYSQPEEQKSPVIPGLHLIFGGAGSHKSHRLSVMHQLLKKRQEESSDFSMAYVIIGEPDHRSKGSWPEIVATIRYGLIDGDDVLVPDVLLMDSFKDLLYMPGTSTMSGGVNAEFILHLSNLSAQLMREGRAVIAVVNPSQEKLMVDLYETIKSNTTSIFAYNLENKGSGDNRGLYSKFKSSMRSWVGNYYARPEGEEFLSLVGLNGDVLEFIEAEAKAKEIGENEVSKVYRATKPRNLGKKLKAAATKYSIND